MLFTALRYSTPAKQRLSCATAVWPGMGWKEHAMEYDCQEVRERHEGVGKQRKQPDEGEQQATWIELPPPPPPCSLVGVKYPQSMALSSFLCTPEQDCWKAATQQEGPSQYHMLWGAPPKRSPTALGAGKKQAPHKEQHLFLPLQRAREAKIRQTFQVSFVG